MTTVAETPTTELARRLGRPRDDARETAILEAALTLIADVGYDRVTMDAIAARARSSKATIYRRWSSKATLVAAAVRCRAGDYPAMPDTGSLREDLMAAIAVMSEQMSENDLGLLTGIFAAMRTDPDLAEAIREQVFTDKHALISPMFERAVGRGDAIRADSAELFHEIAPAMVIYRLTVANAPIDHAFLAHVVDDVLIPVFTRHTTTPRKELSL